MAALGIRSLIGPKENPLSPAQTPAAPLAAPNQPLASSIYSGDASAAHISPIMPFGFITETTISFSLPR
ncbi:hypothetical protein [Bradyrhizobium sp. USDA 4473]